MRSQTTAATEWLTWALAIIAAAAISFAFAIQSQSPDPIPFGQNSLGDPSSLAELAALGGATHLASTPEEIAAISTAAIEVVVLDVRPSTLNTSDGRFPSGDAIRSSGLERLSVHTEVVAKLVNVRSGELTSERDDLVTLTIGGGVIATRLDKHQAEALGITRVLEQFPHREDGDTSPLIAKPKCRSMALLTTSCGGTLRASPSQKETD